MRSFSIIDHLIDDILHVAFTVEEWARQLTGGRRTDLDQDVWDFH